MASFRGRRPSRAPYRRSSSGGRRSQYGRTRRAGSRSSKGRTMRRVGIGLGIVGAGVLAANAGLLGAAGTSRAIKELAGTAGSIRKWAKKRTVRRAALKASSVAFHAKRVVRIKLRKPRRIKGFKVRRFGKR